jgi:hypothetical protein
MIRTVHDLRELIRKELIPVEIIDAFEKRSGGNVQSLLDRELKISRLKRKLAGSIFGNVIAAVIIYIAMNYLCRRLGSASILISFAYSTLAFVLFAAMFGFYLRSLTEELDYLGQCLKPLIDMLDKLEHITGHSFSGGLLKKIENLGAAAEKAMSDEYEKILQIKRRDASYICRNSVEFVNLKGHFETLCEAHVLTSIDGGKIEALKLP